MDKLEKSIIGFFGSIGCLGLLVVLAIIATFIWGFVEIIGWVTTK